MQTFWFILNYLAASLSLKGREEVGRGAEREKIDLPSSSSLSTCCISWDWIGLKPEAGNSIQICYVCGRNWIT